MAYKKMLNIFRESYGKFLSLNDEDEEIPVRQRAIICAYIREAIYKVKDRQFTTEEILNSFPEDWVWKVQGPNSGKYRGSLSKRIREFVRKEYKTVIADSTLSKIASVTESNNKSSPKYFDVDWKLNWNGGDFADSGSCFTGGSSQRAIFVVNNVWAMRLFDYPSVYEGVGRVWAWPDAPASGMCMLFNAYGYRNDIFAHLLTNWLNQNRPIGYTWQQKSFRSGGEGTGDGFYLNGNYSMIGPRKLVNKWMNRPIRLGLKKRISDDFAYLYNNRHYGNNERYMKVICKDHPHVLWPGLDKKTGRPKEKIVARS